MGVVIVPITHERECIVQDGKKYCESSDTTPKELGGALLAVVVIMAYICFCFTRFMDDGRLLFAALAAPFVILGLILVL